MLSGLTVNSNRPYLLFSSSIHNRKLKTRAYNMYKYHNKLICLQSDSKDGLSLQILDENAKDHEMINYCSIKESNKKTEQEIFIENFV